METGPGPPEGVKKPRNRYRNRRRADQQQSNDQENNQPNNQQNNYRTNQNQSQPNQSYNSRGNGGQRGGGHHNRGNDGHYNRGNDGHHNRGNGGHQRGGGHHNELNPNATPFFYPQENNYSRGRGRGNRSRGGGPRGGSRGGRGGGNRKNGADNQKSNYKSSNRYNRGTPHDDSSDSQSYSETNTDETVQIAKLAEGVSKLISNRTRVKMSEDQRDILLKKISKGLLECSICLDRMKHFHRIWQCGGCYNLLHLKCAKEWSQSQTNHEAGKGWRCPYCQNLCKHVPNRYYCYCGHEENPTSQFGEVPHSCHQPCGRKRDCKHHCPLLCHPGACPPCKASVLVQCNCTQTQAQVKCGTELVCDRLCDQLLQCENHKCELKCHRGDCTPCEKMTALRCRCGKIEKEVACGVNDIWSCDQICGKLKDCGNHECNHVCHPGECDPCNLTPTVATSCPCGKENIDTTVRKSCLDPIPSCTAICGKALLCGHPCDVTCHSGDCPSCAIQLNVTCVCGRTDDLEIDCHSFTIDETNARCDRQCKKKMSCGRHTCTVQCCPDRQAPVGSNTHICTRVCSKKLVCGNHACEDICHRGNCRRCPNVSFDELHCDCGVAVIYPPIQCSTPLPECSEPCQREHACNHDVHHNCHADTSCPPCPVLVEKPCNCGKSRRKNIPCFQKNVSCGAECGLELPCGHECQKTCHLEMCIIDGSPCAQPCESIRPSCGHNCARACHPSSKCEPFDPCETVIMIKCACVRRKQRVSCEKYQQMISHQKRALQKAGSGIGSAGVKISLDCDAECDIQARNRRIAEALDIDQPEYSSSPCVVYPDTIVRFAQDKPQVALLVETNLRRLAQQVEEGVDKKLEYNLPSMSKRERMFVHDLSDYFNIRSTGRDAEPNRFIMLTAEKGKCQIPPNSLAKMLKKSGTKLSMTSYMAKPAQLPSRRNNL